MTDNASIGDCPLCGGHQLRGTTTWTDDTNESVVVVRDVPAILCQQCGEEWFDHAVVKRLQTMVDDAHARGAIVEVVRMAS